MANNEFDVLDAAERAVERINRLIDRSPRRLSHVPQMRHSAQSISANIREGFGRGIGGRIRFLRVARGETEETLRHLSANYRSSRIVAAEYWPLHVLLVVIVKRLNSLIGS